MPLLVARAMHRPQLSACLSTIRNCSQPKLEFDMREGPSFWILYMQQPILVVLLPYLVSVFFILGCLVKNNFIHIYPLINDIVHLSFKKKKRKQANKQTNKIISSAFVVGRVFENRCSNSHRPNTILIGYFYLHALYNILSNRIRFLDLENVYLDTKIICIRYL